MTETNLKRLLNEACELLLIFEESNTATLEDKKRISAIFDELKYSDRIDDELKLTTEVEFVVPLSCLNLQGIRVAADEFTSRMKGTTPSFIPHVIRHEDIPDINNGHKYEWVQIGDSKYGRNMLCNKTGIVRSQTMGEFYGNSIVD